MVDRSKKQASLEDLCSTLDPIVDELCRRRVSFPVLSLERLVLDQCAAPGAEPCSVVSWLLHKETAILKA